jgi:hypothetical protein
MAFFFTGDLLGGVNGVRNPASIGAVAAAVNRLHVTASVSVVFSFRQ